jgi:hypothetical protein
VGVLVFGAILLSPVYLYFATTWYIYVVWTEPHEDGYGSRVLKSVGFLVLPHIIYVVVSYLTSFALAMLLGA